MAMNEYDWGFSDARDGKVEWAWRDQWSEDYARGVEDGKATRVVTV